MAHHGVMRENMVKIVWVTVVLLAAVGGLEAADAMKFLASGFVEVMDDCKKELNMDNLLSELYSFWRQDYSQLQRQTGCAIICMSKKLQLLDDSGKMHHGNAMEYAKTQGAAENVAAEIIKVIHSCEKDNEGISGECARVLEVAKCFRTGIYDLQWEPKVDVLITEVLTEI